MFIKMSKKQEQAKLVVCVNVNPSYLNCPLPSKNSKGSYTIDIIQCANLVNH